MPGRLLVIAAAPPESDTAGAPHAAGKLTAAFLADTVRLASHPAVGAEILLSLPEPAETAPTVFPDLRRIPHRGNSPGERFVHIFSEGFAALSGAVVVIGTGTPHLPVAFVQETFGRLEGDTDAVLGPADDGGYWLIALRELHAELFANIPWGTGDVLEATLKAATAAGVKTALLPGWHSVETASDVDRLRIDLRRGTVFAPATAALLETWAAEETQAGRGTI
jgi:glycosyltransferase A (GT-A) superfamily protein (DUF2064 family)